MANERRGRPPELDKVVGHTSTGEPITAEQRIIETLRMGAFIETAAARAGTTQQTLRAWLKAGAAAIHKQATGGELSENERRYADFSARVHQVEAEAELHLLSITQQAAIGALAGDVNETVHYDRDGNETGRTVRTTTRRGPDPKIAVWRLRTKWPDRYSESLRLTGPDDGPIQVDTVTRIQHLAESARQHLDTPEPSSNGHHT